MNASRAVSLQLRRSLLLFSGLALLIGCSPAADDNAVDDGDAANAASFNLPAVPLPQPPIDRSTLLAAVARAASATAAGADDGEQQRALDGRQFELRIRFGCRGPAPVLQESMLGWTFDQEKRALRVRAMPTISRDDPIARQIVERLDGERIEAVEGFWIPRPWLLDPVCPAAPAAGPARPQPPEAAEPAPVDAAGSAAPVDDLQESQAPPPAWPKVGIAHFFTMTDPRTRRRQMRPYEAVETVKPDQPLPHGFNLVLSGRLQALPSRRVIACVSSAPDNPPECIVSAEIDRVWIERPDTREILAEWGSG